MNAPEQLQVMPVQSVGELDRRKYIGGSAISIVMGLSPWATPLDLYEKMIADDDQVEELTPAKRKFFRRRKRQEPVIAEMLMEDYGVEVTRLSTDENPNRYQDPEHAFMAAEIDFEFRMSAAVRNAFPDRIEFCAIPDGKICNGEIKTVHPFASHEWGEQGSEDVPIHYAAQMMWGLGITHRPATLCAALFGVDTLLCFPIMPDADTIAAMRKQAFDFWHNNVLARVAPDPVNMKDIKNLYARIAGKPTELDMDAYKSFLAVLELRARAAQAERDKDEAEWRLAKFIADDWKVALAERVKKGQSPNIDSPEGAVLLLSGREVGTWNPQSRSTMDAKRLLADHPEFSSYMRASHFRVIREKKENLR